MNKKIIFSLVGLAVVFFITSLIIFLNSGKSSQQSLEPSDSIQEQMEKGLIKVKIFYLNNASRLMQPVNYEFESLSSMNDIYKKYINMLIYLNVVISVSPYKKFNLLLVFFNSFQNLNLSSFLFLLNCSVFLSNHEDHIHDIYF